MRLAVSLPIVCASYLLALPAGGRVAMNPDDFPNPVDLPSTPGLPDPLTMLDGSKVTSPEQWASRRKPELKALFEHYMYGRMPEAPSNVKGVVEREDRACLGGKATKKEIAITFGPAGAPTIHLLLVTPNAAKSPPPAFLGLSFNGNHAALDDPTIALPSYRAPANPRVKVDPANPDGRGKDKDVWSIEKVVDRGYALATFHCGDVAPDHPGFADGVFPAYSKGDGSKRAPDDWGAVAAWAWGLSRAVDYLERSGEVDTARIAVVGHSRLGKAALLAGAFDDRIALTIGHQAGCGGSAPSRGDVGESVKQINDRFPHWFADAFKAFNDHPDRLPIDQNCLIALAAPRPLLLTNGEKDVWANPVGQFDVLKGADPAYRLLGVRGLGEATTMPEPGKLVGDRLAYHIRPGGHAMIPEDWDVFLAFADEHLKAK